MLIKCARCVSRSMSAVTRILSSITSLPRLRARASIGKESNRIREKAIGTADMDDGQGDRL